MQGITLPTFQVPTRLTDSIELLYFPPRRLAPSRQITASTLLLDGPWIIGGPMRIARLVLSAVLTALFLNPSAAQQNASSSTQASQLLRQSLAALQGNMSLTDVTLSGTARRIVGSDDESGTAVFKALASGAGAWTSRFPRASAAKSRT